MQGDVAPYIKLSIIHKYYSPCLVNLDEEIRWVNAIRLKETTKTGNLLLEVTGSSKEVVTGHKDNLWGISENFRYLMHAAKICWDMICKKNQILSGYFTKNCQTVTITQSPLSPLHTFACSCSYIADDYSFSH